MLLFPRKIMGQIIGFGHTLQKVCITQKSEYSAPARLSSQLCRINSVNQRRTIMKKLFTLFTLSILVMSTTKAQHNVEGKGKILMIAANPSVSKQTGWPIGFWGSELTHPYWEFVTAGYEVEIVSLEGGKLELDLYSDPRHESGYSAQDILTLGFMTSPVTSKLIESTKKISEVNPSDYQAIFLVGGQSPMYTFYKNEKLEKFVVDFYETRKPTAIVCHATSVLLNAKLPNGKYLVEGKKWTGFANSEEDIADKAVGQKLQPFRIEDEARKIKNSTFTVAPAFSSYALADGNLITGQQQNSGADAAKLVIQQLSK